MGWSEARLHDWLAGSRTDRALPGHDAAVLRASAGRPVVCTDQTIEGVHFEALTPARAVGAKAAGRALSDLAATAARPRALLLALSAPAATEERWIRGAIGGVRRMARAYGAELVGGDLACAAGPRALNVTALGDLAGRGRPPGRDRARPGQRLVVTGALGGSLLGRHLRLRPRIDEGRWLYARGATAMMDVSDGLARDVDRLARASGVRIDMEVAAVPVHRDARRAARKSGLSALEHALGDGEDHELVASLSPAHLVRVTREAARRCPGLRTIGTVRHGRGLHLVYDGRTERWDGKGGWLHGS